MNLVKSQVAIIIWITSAHRLWISRTARTIASVYNYQYFLSQATTITYICAHESDRGRVICTSDADLGRLLEYSGNEYPSKHGGHAKGSMVVERGRDSHADVNYTVCCNEPVSNVY
jgi:hypothetical protein